MLTIHTATSAASVKKYFEMADYYTQGQETLGQWGGRLAERLGLAGTVDKASFDLLCDNINPATRGPLTPRTNDARRVGYDFVFSGPKSFSILEALASEDDRQALLAAFDAAVRETMAEVEADMQVRVRKGGATCDRATGSMVWAGFDHSTARPVDGGVPDMHRHRHVFCFNATFDPVENRIKAGEFSYIKRDGEYYTAAFYSRLAGRLEGLGYAIDRQGGKRWEIGGVPQAVIERFSKRTLEVEAEADRLGLEGGKLKAELGAKTRSKKQKELTPDQLRAAWDAQLAEGDRDALARVYGRELPPAGPVSAREAVAYAIAHVSEKLSVMPERELKRVALLHGLGSLAIDQVEAELPSHGVIAATIDGRRMATTKELQREEDFIAGVAARGRGTVEPIGRPEGLSRSLADGRSLNDGQWDAVCGLLDSSSRVNLLEGPAGAGKSSLLAKYDEAARLVGQSVAYLATTAAAVEVLEADGFEANTLARFLLDTRMQEAARGGRVVIDESSMLGHRDAVKLMELVEELDLKPVFVGDPMQHGAVDRGSFLHVLKSYGCIRPFKLTEILRQESPDYRAAAKSLSEGETLDGFDKLDRMGWVEELADGVERCRRVAAEYRQALDDKKSVLVVSPTHAEAADITQAIRSELRQAGRLGPDHAFTRLAAVDSTLAERGQATTYRPGDVLQFHQNAKGYTKGDRVTVTDPALVPLEHAGKFSIYHPATITVAAGDVIRFTGTVKTLDGKHVLRNGAARTVAEITPGGNVRLDNGWVVAKDCGHFRHGFVETSFGSQGRTVQRSILAMSSASLGATNQEQLYVSSSRAREQMMLYTDDKAAVRQAILRSSRKLAALDLQPAAVAKPGDRLRRERDRKRRLGYCERLRAAVSRAIRHRPGQATATPKTINHHADRLRDRERSGGHER